MSIWWFGDCRTRFLRDTQSVVSSTTHTRSPKHCSSSKEWQVLFSNDFQERSVRKQSTMSLGEDWWILYRLNQGKISQSSAAGFFRVFQSIFYPNVTLRKAKQLQSRIIQTTKIEKEPQQGCHCGTMLGSFEKKKRLIEFKSFKRL